MPRQHTDVYSRRYTPHSRYSLTLRATQDTCLAYLVRNCTCSRELRVAFRMALQNKVVIYNLLFKATAETLLEAAADWKDLKAKIGFVAILHTWGQKLDLHPHLHCVVPGGGVSLDGTRWISCPRGFLMPVKLLSRLFRGKFLALLKDAYRRGQLTLAGRLQPLKPSAAFHCWLTPLYAKDWMVFAKPPWNGPDYALKYLARYTHRVAIANSRLQSIEDGQVTFTYKDYRHGHRQRTLTLAATEFIRRFMMHVLPSGFVRIRYYGFLANAHRQEQLSKIRQLLDVPQPAMTHYETDDEEHDPVSRHFNSLSTDQAAHRLDNRSTDGLGLGRTLDLARKVFRIIMDRE